MAGNTLTAKTLWNDEKERPVHYAPAFLRLGRAVPSGLRPTHDDEAVMDGAPEPFLV
jgi:hypothetical protein